MLEIFLIFLRLGLTSFGGPVAHLSYFHDEFVRRRRWFAEQTYADLVALCQFLPGPASSQVGLAVGLSRGGIPGALAAWLGFTLPSALLLTLFALGLHEFPVDHSWLHGLKIATVAVVAQAVWAMGRKLCPDFPRAVIALAGAALILWIPVSWLQLVVIAAGGAIGFFLKQESALPEGTLAVPLSRRAALVFLALFFGLLLILPLLAAGNAPQSLKLFDSFYRAGSLVFGGGHVVLPLLQSEVVPPGWVSNDTFLAGYGAAQAVPGPLFTFSAYLGAASSVPPNGWLGAALCLVAAFLPSFLLVFGTLPHWDTLRRNHAARRAMLGINAAVVGLLLAALWRPVITGAIHSAPDLAVAIAAFVALSRVPAWAIVPVCAIAGRVLL